MYEVDSEIGARFFTGPHAPEERCTPKEMATVRAATSDVEAALEALHMGKWIETDSSPTVPAAYRAYWLTAVGRVALRKAQREGRERIAKLFPAGD